MRATYSRGAAVFFALALAAVPALAQEQPENEPVIRTTRPVVRVGQGYIVRSGDVVSNVLFKKLRLRELKHQTDAPPERTQVDSGLAQVIVENADLAALGPQ